MKNTIKESLAIALVAILFVAVAKALSFEVSVLFALACIWTQVAFKNK